MKVLVAVASKHGSTRDIAGAIAGELRAMGLAAEVRDAVEVAALDGYDAVVLGSAVYMGRRLPEARHFVAAHQPALCTMPVWLFSSGPLGADQPVPADEPSQLEDLVAAIHARGHQIFAGRLAPADLGLGERLIAKAARAPAGDFRAWDAIRSWARTIGTALRPGAIPAGAPSLGASQEGTS